MARLLSRLAVSTSLLKEQLVLGAARGMATSASVAGLPVQVGLW